MNANPSSALPILYSFRRCPYAIRARLAIARAGLSVELREVLLRDKPQEMLAVSSKGTVPVLELADGQIIDESIDVMRWALDQYDPDDWLSADDAATESLIEENDGSFKFALDRYKYFERFPEKTQTQWRQDGEEFLTRLEKMLAQHDGAALLREHYSFADMAIFPFIRQFRGVDADWFDQSRYEHLQKWLGDLLQSELFLGVMAKHPPWQSGRQQVVWP